MEGFEIVFNLFGSDWSVVIKSPIHAIVNCVILFGLIFPTFNGIKGFQTIIKWENKWGDYLFISFWLGLFYLFLFAIIFYLIGTVLIFSRHYGII